MPTPVHGTITRRRRLAQDARNDLFQYRKYYVSDWPSKTAPRSLALAAANIGRALKLEGYEAAGNAVGLAAASLLAELKDAVAMREP